VLRRLAVLLLAALSLAAGEPGRARSVTLVHFSDYHSHAVPFTSEGQPGTAGIARAILALRAYASDPKTLVFSGGDMLNAGAPAWSDKYGCVEWPWLSSIVSAMALGNHDADYGPEAFARCRRGAGFPILSANAVGANGHALFPGHAVLERNGVKVGVFAVAGPDFESLVPRERRPLPTVRFGDPIAAARAEVAALRGPERADVVVLIGHESHEDDLALAQAVPGIDVIFGTHSHRKEELTRIPGTSTWTISPYQYLTYLSKVQVEVTDGRVTRVSGGLEPMSASLSSDMPIALKVARMQGDLEADPKYKPLFGVIGTASDDLSIEGIADRDAPLGDLVADVVREAAKADVALLTSSSFREAIPKGEVREETLRAALPYPNKVLVYAMPGALLAKLLETSAARRGSDAFCQVSGVLLDAPGGSLRVRVAGSDGPAPLDPARVYRVAVSEFLALTSPVYAPLLAGAAHTDTGLEVRDLLRKSLRAGAASPRRDGRIAI
jgi:5'-nucleotidase